MQRAAQTTLRIALIAGSILLWAPTAQAQEWLLDDSLRVLTKYQKDRLLKDVQDAPLDALETILEQEADHLEALHKEDLEKFGQEAWKRLLAGREEGRLWKTLKAELKTAGVYSKELLTQVWTEERKRLHTFKERVAYALVDRALRAVLIDRIRELRYVRLSVARAEANVGDARGNFPFDQPDTVFNWREVPKDAPTERLDVSTGLPIPRVSFWSDEARFRKELLDKRWDTKLGDVRVTAAEVVGLAEAKAGTVRYQDEFGRKIEGLGAHFTAKARFTAARGTFTSKEVAAAKDDLGVRARVYAMAHALNTAEISAGAVISEKGFGTHNRIKVGAGSEARIRVPITIDLKVITLRVTPYASAHAGVSAEAHANFEVEWTGKVRLDMGASLSKGIGAGAGVLIEIELGPVVRRYLAKLIRKIEALVRPVADYLMGRSWRGPAVPTNRLTLTLDDLERHAARQEGAATPQAAPQVAPKLEHRDVALRYAPVIYQRIRRGRYDLLRRVDYDGDWNTLNNFDNATEMSKSKAFVYYDVKETETHYFLSYGFYHAGRKSNAIRPLRNMRRHENDMGGCIVVVRKGATPGREVEVLVTTNGSKSYTYSALERKDDKKTRWKTRDGRWSGPVQFVDEVGHPLMDLERTHPQVWINGKAHDVYGFTGRDDRHPFSGDEGIVYVPTGSADAPKSYRDHRVGYDLLPMTELLTHVDDPNTYTVNKQILEEVAFRPLPRRFRGDEGPDDRATPPWAWQLGKKKNQSSSSSRRSSRRTTNVLDEGVLFIDPARSLDVLFRLPKDFSQTYTHNPWLKVPIRNDGEIGLIGNVK